MSKYQGLLHEARQELTDTSHTHTQELNALREQLHTQARACMHYNYIQMFSFKDLTV